MYNIFRKCIDTVRYVQYNKTIKSNNKFGGESVDKLKDIRELARLKQYEAAEKLDISKDYLCMLENGRRSPSNKLISKMSKLYNVAPEKVFLAANRTICTDGVQESA